MTLHGHQKPWTEWESALASGRIHHAWLLAGMSGLGKGAFARKAALRLVHLHSEESHFSHENHPDILILERPPDGDTETRKRDDGLPYKRKRNIPIDAIRAMKARLTTQPTLSKSRAVIIDSVDDLEIPAANALLKVLEEPPTNTYFLLVSHRLGQILPTIRSRCRMLRFAPLQPDEMCEMLSDIECSEATRDAAIEAARGIPGVAIAIIKQDLGPIHDVMAKLIREGDPDMMLRGKLADFLGVRPDHDRLQSVLDLARTVLSNHLPDAPHHEQARIIETHGEIVRLGSEVTIYNYDPRLLMLHIGGLLSSIVAPQDTMV